MRDGVDMLLIHKCPRQRARTDSTHGLAQVIGRLRLNWTTVLFTQLIQQKVLQHVCSNPSHCSWNCYHGDVNDAKIRATIGE